MDNQVKETGIEKLARLRKEAAELGIKGLYKADEFERLIKEAMENAVIVEPIKQSEKSGNKITSEEAKAIESRLRYEDELREKFKVERQIKTDRATIIAESESLKIDIDLPENPTELDLARARRTLGIKKVEVKPSPETVAIEASKRGYYVFTNLEQDDANHTVNLGGKYIIHLIPDQILVLSEYHVKKWKQIAIWPIYKRVTVPGEPVAGQMKERCERVGGKPRFAFEYLGEAPQDADFGLVTDMKILDELRIKEEQLV